MNKTQCLLAYLLLVSPVIFAQRVIIHFDAPLTNTPSVSKAILRYDKDFAYSLTFDDGDMDGYTCGLPALQGGVAACSGANLVGLFFSDGCGNNVPFRAGIAINAANALGQDSHDGSTPNKLTWQQLDELYDKGWDILNHSWSHKSRWTNSMVYQDYVSEIERNKTDVRAKTRNRMEMPAFVVPSGDGIYQDIAYSLSNPIVFDQSANAIGINGLAVNADFSPNGRVVHRQLLEEALNLGQDKVGAAASRGASGDKVWYNEFTHAVNGTTGLGFAQFRSHVERIANTWGRNGTDKVWMAPLQEVFEYLTVRQKISYTLSVDGNQLILDFNLSQLPMWLRRKPLTLVVNSNSSFSRVDVPQAVQMTHSGRNAKKLINLDFANVNTTMNPCDRDSTPPVFTNCPQNISLTTTNSTAQATWMSPTATDNCTATPSVVGYLNPGVFFSIGTTVVSYTAIDAKGNRATCRFNVVVTQQAQNPCDTDRIAPVFQNCPPNLSLNTTNNAIIANWIAPTTTDNCTATPSVSTTHQSGSTFYLGITTVIYTVSDAKANSAICSFTVTVSQQIQNPCIVDTIRPLWSNCPKDTVVRINNSHTTVSWTTPRVTDNCSIASVSNNYSSGSSFQVGMTTVNYTASDVRGNRSTCSFKVTVMRGTKSDLAIQAEPKTLTYSQWSNNDLKITATNQGSESLSSIKIEIRFPDKVVNGGGAIATAGVWEEVCVGNIACYEWQIPSIQAGQKASLNLPIFIQDATAPITLTAQIQMTSPMDLNTLNNTALFTLNPVQFVGNQSGKVVLPNPFVPVVLTAVLPDPTEGDVLVQLESLTERTTRFEFYNLIGQLVKTENRLLAKGKSKMAFDLWDLKAGIYFLKTDLANSRTKILRFVKI